MMNNNNNNNISIDVNPGILLSLILFQGNELHT